eukprot:scaffold16337_cov76-Cylindrotheca_fusiformis.AAC.2
MMGECSDGNEVGSYTLELTLERGLKKSQHPRSFPHHGRFQFAHDCIPTIIFIHSSNIGKSPGSAAVTPACPPPMSIRHDGDITNDKTHRPFSYSRIIL